MLRSRTLRLGRLVYHGHEMWMNGASASRGIEASHVKRWVHMASTGNSGASRIGLHIFDQNTRSNKSSPQDPGDKDDNSDASKGMRWRIVESRDLKTMNKAHGKVVDDKAGTFLPEHVAPEWPPMLVESKLSGEEEFSRPAPGINARVVLGSFRAAAEMYLSEWRNVVRDTFGDQEDVELVELAVCDVGVMKMWPFKGFLMSASRAKGGKRMMKMPVRHVHHFGDVATVTEGLNMNNRLTGYVFVVDDRGRIRWRSTGKLTEAESHSMMQAVRALSPDQNKEIDS